MKISININESFSTESFFTYRVERDYDPELIPTCQGVYIFHNGKLSEIWKTKNRIFYIGGTNKEGLRTRIRKHMRALLGDDSQGGTRMREFGKDLDPEFKNTYFSFLAFETEREGYIPFLFEIAIIEKYKQKFGGVKPALNKGDR